MARRTCKIKNEKGCRKYKSFDPTFSKVGRGSGGQSPWSTVSTVETPRISEKVVWMKRKLSHLNSPVKADNNKKTSYGRKTAAGGFVMPGS